MKLALITEDTDKSEKDKETPQAGDLGQYITTKQAAEILGVDASRVRQFIMDGRLKAHNPVPGRRDNFLKRADVESFDKQPRERTGRPDEGKGTSEKKESVEADFAAELIVEETEKGEYTHEIYDRKEKKVVGKYKNASKARLRADKLDNEYGAYRYSARRIGSQDA